MTKLSLYLQNEGVSRNETLQLFSFLFPLQHMKKAALQNKRVGVLGMAFRAREVFGTFEERAPGLKAGTVRPGPVIEPFPLPRNFTRRERCTIE